MDIILNNLINDFSIENLKTFANIKFDINTNDNNLYVNEKYEDLNITPLGKVEKDYKEFGFFAIEVEGLKDKPQKKNQYLIAKDLLKDNYLDYGIFVFYTNDKSAFRLSLVSTNYDENNKPLYTSYKRYTYYVSKNRTNNTFIKQIENLNSDSKLKDILEAFSLQTLSDDFYEKIADWYSYALKTIKKVKGFPRDIEEKEESKFIVRLITRIMFIWFIKEVNLVNKDLFDYEKIQNIIKYNRESSYYKAILQNLFFPTLSVPMNQRQYRIDSKGFVNGDFGDFKKYRYNRTENGLESYFLNEYTTNEGLKSLFDNTPFFNGNIFECRDIPVHNEKVKAIARDKEGNILRDKSGNILMVYTKENLLDENGRTTRERVLFERQQKSKNVKFPDSYLDGFSEATYTEKGKLLYRSGLNIPNELFFNKEFAKTNNSELKDLGIIDILSLYNFTIDENTVNDSEISVDPELLGRIFESLLGFADPTTNEIARKLTGSFYTPREIVSYMCKETLKEYILTCIEKDLNKEDIKGLKEYIEQKGCKDFTDIDNFSTVFDKSLDYKLKEAFIDKLNDLFDEEKNNPFNTDTSNKIINYLYKVKIIDPACGSGAYPIGILQVMHEVLNKLDSEGATWKNLILNDKEIGSNVKNKIKDSNNSNFIHKLGIIQKSIYGVDIQPMATEISRLRCYLSLIVDETVNKNDIENNFGIMPLPNLDFKFTTCDSLMPIPHGVSSNLTEIENEFERIRKEYLNSHDDKESLSEKQETKEGLKKAWEKNIKNYKALNKFDVKLDALSEWNPFNTDMSPWFDSNKMFGVSAFDIVIGNPPYVSTKGVSATDKNKQIEIYGFSDDLYNLFFFRSIKEKTESNDPLSLCKEDGILSFITSKSYWTTETKSSLRKLLLTKKVLSICDTENPFKGSALVDTAIFTLKNTSDIYENEFDFITYNNIKGTNDKDYNSINRFPVKQSVFINGVNNSIFIPNKANIYIYNKYNNLMLELLNKWKRFILSSTTITRGMETINFYKNDLKEGDLTLLGLITVGGQGLATGNNGRFVGLLEGTPEAIKIESERKKRFAEFCLNNDIYDYGDDKNEIYDYIDGLSETEIRDLFDEFKEEYGRDIFKQGFLFRIVSNKEIKNVNTMTKHEKEYGIKGDKTFVPYDKGDKDGNRWYLRTPYYIDWSEDNVATLKANVNLGKGGSRYQNPQFYFREGFCWNNVLQPTLEESKFIKCRLKGKSVHDVASMSLFENYEKISDKYIVSLLNSKFMYNYLKTFINNSVNLQIDDFREFPIIIPSETQLKDFEDIFDRAFAIKEKQFDNVISEEEAKKQLNAIQNELDEKVYKLYGFTEDEIAIIENN